MSKICKVSLQEDEQALADDICWDLNQLQQLDYGRRIEIFEKMGQLTESLLRRSAIPSSRIKYLTDPEFFVGGYGKSRKQVFERNGCIGHEIFRHPDFMKYLRYFIHGPDLPEDTIAGFCKIVEEDRGTSGEVLDQITSFVRKQTKDEKLEKHATAEEFFKLAHEIGQPHFAEAARSAAISVR